jgi:hypothetical protein
MLLNSTCSITNCDHFALDIIVQHVKYIKDPY